MNVTLREQTKGGLFQRPCGAPISREMNREVSDAYSQPLPSALLRPLQQPLYDTESLPAALLTEGIYFQRQLGQTMANAAVVKTASETNLQQPGQLANPLEFSLFGFLFEVSPGTTLADFIQIYLGGVWTFTYTRGSWCLAA